MLRTRPSRASRLVEQWLESGTDDEPHTQEILARRLSEHVHREVSQSTISNIKNGAQMPRADLLGAFKLVLKIEAEWWLPEQTDSERAA